MAQNIIGPIKTNPVAFLHIHSHSIWVKQTIVQIEWAHWWKAQIYKDFFIYFVVFVVLNLKRSLRGGGRMAGNNA